ncbi:hypothetical protein GGI19_005286 [Coemansia pectinata]|uniref:HD domain-containing protein n=1 Tax=Coemansia pectinata TaxID=1052879 RepID=A0A9W8L986_9FUNG|nr:hypothetical protein GGI19_005286 [Coemansia pectinata]
MSATKTPEQRVSMAFYYRQFGGRNDDIYKYRMPQNHALQAAHRAKNEGADEETIVAALLQDIGRFCPPPEEWSDNPGKTQASYQLYDAATNYTSVDYGRLGADYLRMLRFPTKTCELVESYTMAKRYLMSVDFTYLDYLKETNSLPLDFHGKQLSSDEMSEFEKDPLFHQKVQLRKWSSIVESSGDNPPSFDTYFDMAVRIMPI